MCVNFCKNSDDSDQLARSWSMLCVSKYREGTGEAAHVHKVISEFINLKIFLPFPYWDINNMVHAYIVLSSGTYLHRQF